MNTATTSVSTDASYEGDFHAWCEQQVARLRARARLTVHDGIDYENLAEEIEGLARSDQRTIRSHLRVLLAHLLKWRQQANKRTDSSTDSIFNARIAIADLIEESPSLERYAQEAIARSYPLAVRDAAAQTGLPHRSFAASCPFAVSEVFDPEFLPS
jgi:hypothetical protein